MNEEVARKRSRTPSVRTPHWTDHILNRYCPLLCLIVGLTVALIVGGPTVLWWYHSERAGHFMTLGLRWSQNHQVDELPELVSTSALSAAQHHLDAATYWHPNSAITYRQLGESYAAQHNWSQAAQAFEHAKALAPLNPLAAWEAGLVYEQMWYAIAQAPSDGLVGTLAEGHLEPPSSSQRTQTCDKPPMNCSLDTRSVAQPYAGFPEASNAVRLLRLQPGARLSYPVRIPPERPALHFLLGRDLSDARSPSLAATYHLWVTTAGATPVNIYNRAIDVNTMSAGWSADAVDLAGWAGHVVTLTLSISLDAPSLSRQLSFGWGDVTLTTMEAAQFAVKAPEAHMRAAWRQAGFDAQRLVARGDDAFNVALYAQAFPWYNRVLKTQASIPYDLLFRSGVAASLAGRDDATNLWARVRALDNTFDVYQIDNQLTIPGAALRWLTPLSSNTTYGTPLNYGASPSSTYGYFWGTGQGIAMVTVAKAAHYEVRVRAQHGIPPPIEMALGIDGQRVQHALLQRGNNSWETLTMSVDLSPGLHTINIWFLNDGFVDGHDRNAVVDLVTISRDRT